MNFLKSVTFAVLTASLVTAHGQNSLTNGLVCFYPLNGTAADSLGNGNTGTLNNGAYYTNGIANNPNSAVFCNGAEAYVYIGKNDAVYPNQVLTWSVWFMPQSTNPGFIYWDDDSQPGGDRYIAVAGGNAGQAAISAGSSGQLSVSSLTIALSQWHHAVFTSDVSGQFLYLDGQLISSFNSILPNHSGRSSVAIGSRGDGFGNVYGYSDFQGAICNLSIYNRALSSNEVAQLYQSESPSPRNAAGVATLSNGFVTGVSIADTGYAYTNTPLVRLIGGGGSGALAFATVSNGIVTGITVTNAGYGYTNAPLVVIDPPFIPQPVLSIAPMSFLSFSNLTIGGVYQLQRSLAWYWTNQPLTFTATSSVYAQMFAGIVGSGNYRLAINPVPAQAFATPQVVNGFVVGATVTSGGSGYITSPTVSIVGKAGTNATAVSRISGGVVTNISITGAGIGYTNGATIEIAPPPAATIFPTVQPVMQINSASLAPYDNYQIQFTPAIGGTWGNWNGGLFTPTGATNSQFLFITNGTGFFRLQYEP